MSDERPRLIDGRPFHEVCGTQHGIEGHLEGFAWLNRHKASRLQPRGAGRPGWTAALFDARWHEAVSRITTAPPHRLADVAVAFRGLDDEPGIDAEHLRRLRRRRGLGKLPAE